MRNILVLCIHHRAYKKLSYGRGIARCYLPKWLIIEYFGKSLTVTQNVTIDRACVNSY